MTTLTKEQIDELRERSKNDRAIIVGSEIRQLCDMASALLDVRKGWVSVPKAATTEQVQLIFNWIMGDEELGSKYGWWGTDDQVAKAREFYELLLAAAKGEGNG